jgi:hypothetical protein
MDAPDRGAHRQPPSGAIEEAKRRHNGWVYEIQGGEEPTAASHPNGSVAHGPSTQTVRSRRRSAARPPPTTARTNATEVRRCRSMIKSTAASRIGGHGVDPVRPFLRGNLMLSSSAVVLDTGAVPYGPGRTGRRVRALVVGEAVTAPGLD